MTNAYYNHTSAAPANQVRAIASVVRGELDLIVSGLNLLPTPTQLYAGSANYCLDTGVASALLIATSTSVVAYANGQRYLVKALFAATGASTINVTGATVLGLKSILRTDGLPTQAGDWALGQNIELVYSDTYGAFTFNQATAAQVSAAAAYSVAAAASAAAAAVSAAAALVSQNAAAASAVTAAASVASAKFGLVAYLNNSFTGM